MPSMAQQYEDQFDAILSSLQAYSRQGVYHGVDVVECGHRLQDLARGVEALLASQRNLEHEARREFFSVFLTMLEKIIKMNYDSYADRTVTLPRYLSQPRDQNLYLHMIGEPPAEHRVNKFPLNALTAIGSDVMDKKSMYSRVQKIAKDLEALDAPAEYIIALRRCCDYYP